MTHPATFDRVLRHRRVALLAGLSILALLLAPMAAAEQEGAPEASATPNASIVRWDREATPQWVDENPERFGLSFFDPEHRADATDPISAIPLDYRIGPGDVLMLQLYGRSDEQIRVEVRSDGTVTVPEVGPITVMGLRFEEFDALVRERIATARLGERVSISLVELRDIKVIVSGEVADPGPRLMGGLSTVLDAIHAAGGVTETGSLRRIRLLRGDRVVSTLDLYDLLLEGRRENDRKLLSGDVVLVETLGDVVSVQGRVLRPGLYETLGKATVGGVIELAGGLRPDADPRSAHIERILSADGRALRGLDLNEQAALRSRVANGDVVRVFPKSNALDAIVSLEGHVLRPGARQWTTGMTARDLVSGPGELLPDADLSVAFVERETGLDRRIETLLWRVGEELSGRRAPLRLRARDRVTVLPRVGDRARILAPVVDRLRSQESYTTPAPVVSVQGNVRYPGSYPLSVGMKLGDLLAAAGQPLAETDAAFALLVRSEHPSRRIDPVEIGLSAKDLGLLLQPRDAVYVFHAKRPRAPLVGGVVQKLREQARLQERARVVAVRGRVQSPGEYPLTPDMDLATAVRAAGGLTEEAFGLSVELTRQSLAIDETIAVEHLLLSASEALDPGLALRPYDEVTILRKPDVPETRLVRLSGEVRHPGTYPVREGERLAELLARAGGLTDEAYPFGARFSRESVRREQQIELDRIVVEREEILASLSLSPGRNRYAAWGEEGAADPKEFNAIRSVDALEASGRLVIDLDAILEGEAYADLLLEHEDHLHVPKDPQSVSVFGQVYRPTSHRWEPGRGARDYIERSGGETKLAHLRHAYVIHADGSVEPLRRPWWRFGGTRNPKLAAGAVVVVPLHLDRINGLEYYEGIMQPIAAAARWAGMAR